MRGLMLAAMQTEAHVQAPSQPCGGWRWSQASRSPGRMSRNRRSKSISDD